MLESRYRWLLPRLRKLSAAASLFNAYVVKHNGFRTNFHVFFTNRMTALFIVALSAIEHHLGDCFESSEDSFAF